MAIFDYKSDSKRSLRLSDKYYDLAISYFDNFTDKLISVSLFSLGFISLLFQKIDIRNYPFSEYIFILGTLSFIVTILLGVLLKILINGFLNNVGTAYYERHKKIESFIYTNNSSEGETLIDEIILDLPKVPSAYWPWWHKLQIVLFSIGVICFGFLLFSLFTFDSFKDKCLQII